MSDGNGKIAAKEERMESQPLRMSWGWEPHGFGESESVLSHSHQRIWEGSKGDDEKSFPNSLAGEEPGAP